MYLKSLLTPIVVLTIATSSIGQMNQEFKSEGPIPDDILDNSIDKATENSQKTLESSDTKDEQKLKSEFVLKSTYKMDELLTSGKVVFGSKANDIVNKIGNELLVGQDKDEIRFYILKSNMANAFSTHQGMIFITTELLSRIDTEAELAFVLAHEIAHYSKKHAINKFIEADKVYSQRKKLKYENYDDDIRKMSVYSQSLEFEADIIGFERFNELGYRSVDAKDLLNKLKISHLSIDTTKADIKLISDLIPDELIIHKNYTIDYDDNDSLQTHPAIDKRVAKIVETGEGENGKQFIYSSKDEIEGMRDQMIEVGLMLKLQSGDYITTVDNALHLIKKDPSNEYTNMILAKALYNLAKYKVFDAYDELTNRYYSYDGNALYLKDFFDELNEEQFCALAIEKISSIDNRNTTLESMLRDLTLEMGLLTKGDAENYLAKAENIEEDSLAKYFQIVMLAKNDDFKNEYQEVSDSIAAIIKKKQEEHDFLMTMSFDKRQKYLKKQAKKNPVEIDNSFETGKIGAEKIVYVDPDYKIVDERKGLKLVNSEEAKNLYSEQIIECANASDLNIDLIVPKKLNSNDSEKYNDLGTMNAAFGEMLLHAKFGLANQIVLSSSEDLLQLSNKYNTPFFAYNGQIVYKEIKRGKGLAIAVSAIYMITLPLGILYAVTPKYEAYYYNIVVNAESGKFVTASFEEMPVKPTYGRTVSMIYNDMSILKSK